MVEARGQAERYAKALPIDHGWPPFLLVTDVGHCIDVYADFSGTGKQYTQFPDAARFRIALDDLRSDDVRARLGTIWTDPLSLDPSKEAARVTREIAGHLAELSKRLEKREQNPTRVADFLMRCLFTMFDLSIGAEVASASPLKSNRNLSWMGVKVSGDGFKIDADKRAEFLRLGYPDERLPLLIAGNDLTDRQGEVYAIDTDGLSEADLRLNFPAVYQHLHDYVIFARAWSRATMATGARRSPTYRVRAPTCSSRSRRRCFTTA